MGRRILICGGGTAGHIYPAISVIEEIQENYKDAVLLYVGSNKGMEKTIIPGLGIDFVKINASGLIQKGSPVKKTISYLKFVWMLTSGFFKSLKLISNFKPDMVLGMGGYACGPVLLGAVILRKKIALHEQNYIPGRLNKFFSKFCSCIFISFKETKNYLKIPETKIIYSGNPVRKVIRNFSYKERDYEKYGLKKGKFTITAFGGSLGADKINNVFIELFEILRKRENVQFLLISGKRFYDNLKNNNKNLFIENNLSLSVFPYINEMDEVYNITDLIISRSGANSVAEIAYCNIPAILIPYPWAIDNHQYFNAGFLEKNGKAIIIEDANFSCESLIKIINDLEKESKKLYNELKYKKIDIDFIRGHKIITKYLVGEKG
ncbi:undecaprenyldiphospho-muramoylpentapeptide beta-N-acetylglucosaminyltransferase [bacterium]|nr:undecaprenyldiphospho-muramoylpentapeptide beta-N-acetylglucosaminyltransferase [bacterium]